MDLDTEENWKFLEGTYLVYFAAEKLNIHHVFSGPNQQSEIVGNHNYVVANQLKLPAILKFVTGGPLLPPCSKP